MTLSEPAVTDQRRQKDKLERFARSLGIALFDRKLELEGHRLIFFFDADVVIHMVSGFDRSRLESAEAQLVQSLLACHIFGNVAMLRPHLLEVDSTLRSLPRPSSPAELEGYQSRARQFLESRGINDVMRQLREIVTSSNLEPKDKTERFIEVLSHSAGRTFAAIEQFSGSWSQRLTRFRRRGLLDFDHLGAELNDLFDLQRKEIFDVLSILNDYRPKDRDQNLRDSAAIAVIQKMIWDHARDGSIPIPRFYTDTEKLRAACFHDPRLRRIIGDPEVDLQGAPDDARLSIRDSWYFIMRARFEGLAPGGYEGQKDAADFEDLYRRLKELLTSEDIDIRAQLELINWKGQPLPEVVEQFEQLSLMRSIWVRHRIPDYVIEALPEWTEVFDFAQRGQTDRELFGQIDEIYGDLSQKLSLAKRWTNDYRMLFRAARRRRERIRGDLEDPMRDLGLVRWGYTLSESEKEDLVRTVTDLLQTNDERLMEQCGRLASRIDLARTKISECLSMTAVLWILYEFGEIVRLVDELAKHVSGGVPPSLFLVQAAARIRATISLGLEERRSLIQKIWDLRESIPKQHLGGYLLGLGYVLYRAWKYEKVGDGVRKESVAIDAEVAEWADRCFSVGEEAVSILPETDLAWAFAVNHCVYVGIMTARPRSEIEPYLATLIMLQDGDVWNFRFDDTMGCYYLVDIEREWAGTDPERRHQLDFRNRIDVAKKYFESASRHDFGDIDLDEHLGRLHRIEILWEKVRSEATQE